MPLRLAGTLSLVCFVACLLAGVLLGDNPLETAVLRALLAMAGTFGVGLVVGWMAAVMLREKISADAAALEQARRRQAELEEQQPERDEEILTVG